MEEDRYSSSGFFAEVYRLVARIPAGRVATYGQLAAMLGRPRAARTVGWAMHSAPPAMKLPCHRVVNRSGTLAPGDIFGGTGHQRLMLEAEGVTFGVDGRINMRRHIW